MRLQFWRSGKCGVLYSQNHNMVYEIQWTNETHIYINTSFILFSKGAHSLLLVWEIDGKTYTQRGDFFLPRIFFLGSRGAKACTPSKPYRQRHPRRLWSAACPWLDSRFSALCVNHGYHVVSFQLHTCWTWQPQHAAISLFANHNVTACQSTHGH